MRMTSYYTDIIDERYECECCGHIWAEHARMRNGSFACRHFGCGCSNVVYPINTSQPRSDK
jgi:hypothetical protein